MKIFEKSSESFGKYFFEKFLVKFWKIFESFEKKIQKNTKKCFGRKILINTSVRCWLGLVILFKQLQ